MSKGIAVPYIIALILGIVVVALIGYWFFAIGSVIPGQQTISNCNIKMQQFCTEWSRTNFAGNEPAGGWDSYPGAEGCRSLGVPPIQYQLLIGNYCRSLLGLTTTVTTPAPATGGGTGGGQQAGTGSYKATCTETYKNFLNGQGGCSGYCPAGAPKDASICNACC